MEVLSIESSANMLLVKFSLDSDKLIHIQTYRQFNAIYFGKYYQ